MRASRVRGDLALLTSVRLRHASATGVTAISAGSPIITRLLVVFARHISISTRTLLGLGLVFVAVLLIFSFGRRQAVRGFADNAQPGDFVAVHWDWVCAKLTPSKLQRLIANTNRYLELANTTI